MADKQKPSTFSARVEDHALTQVPLEERRSGWQLVTNTAGIATTLVQLGIAAIVSSMVGVLWGIVAGILVAIFGAALGWLVGQVAYVSGTSSTVTTRYYGLGRRGSIIASIVFAFMILGFLALENALLYYGTLFAFGWRPTLENALVIYGIFSIAWVLLTMYGMRVVQAVSMILLVGFVILTAAVAAYAVATSSKPFLEILMEGPALSSPSLGATFTQVIAILAGSAGALALVDADYARYARSAKDVGILAIGGSVAIDIIVVILGALIGHASTGKVVAYLHANPAAAAALGGNTVAAKVAWMLHNNAGAYFVILFGAAGFILMYIAQIKAQVLNTYSGSLSLSNLAESIFGRFGRSIGRFGMVIIGNIIALGMIAFNILGLLSTYLALLGITTTAVAAIVIADYFIVRRRRPARMHEMEQVNWAGVIAVIVGTVVASLVVDVGVTPLGFLVSLVIVLILYPLLRISVLRPSRGATMPRRP